MKRVPNFFKSLLSLGGLGLIMLLMAGLILLVSLVGTTPAFYTAQARVSLLDMLEDPLSAALGDMQLSEAYQTFVLQYGFEDDGSNTQAALEADAEITRLLDDLRANGHFDLDTTYAAALDAALEDFNATRAAHRATFEQMLAAYQAENTDEAERLLSQLQEENDALSASLNQMVLAAERDRLEAAAAFPAEANQGIWIAAVSLTGLLLLGLAGYQRVAAATRPLHQLRSAINAIGGDQYRPALLGSLTKQGGAAGALARALDGLAQEQQSQTAGLKLEIERLRQALYESRRRRLKLHRETESGGQNG